MYWPQYLNREYETVEYWDHNGYLPVQRNYVVSKPTWKRKQLHEIKRNYGRKKIR